MEQRRRDVSCQEINLSGSDSVIPPTKLHLSKNSSDEWVASGPAPDGPQNHFVARILQTSGSLVVVTSLTQMCQVKKEQKINLLLTLKQM